MKPSMYVYSGDCRLCDVGQPVGFHDSKGNALRTGDIVITFTVDSLGFSNLGGLTVVVSDQYQSFTDGSHVENEAPSAYVMGIRSVQVDEDGQWRVLRLKKWEDVIPGESWPDYGFSFRAKEPQV